jgi:hypothetical protein
MPPRRLITQNGHAGESLGAWPLPRLAQSSKPALVKGAPRSDVSRNDESIDRQARQVIHDKMHSAQTSGGRRVVE